MADEPVDPLHPAVQDIKTSLDKVWTATFDWSSFLQTPTGKAIGIMAVTLLGLVIAKINTAMNPPVPTPPVTVNVAAAAPLITPIEPKMASPLPAPMKLVLYVTDKKQDASKSTAFRGLMVSISVDPKTWPAGTVIPFGGKEVPLPCGVLMSPDGKTVLDVVHYETDADLVAMVKSHPQGK